MKSSTSNMPHSRIRSIVLCGLSIALLAVGAFITVPLGPVPFTLQTMMLLIIINILTPQESIVAVGGYLLLGAIGLPIGAGYRGGIAWLFGPTGGFLMGFLLATIVIALLRYVLSHFSKTNKTLGGVGSTLALAVASAVITYLIYNVFGVLWFMSITSATVEAALAACVVPFVIGDVVKAVVAISCVHPVLSALGRAQVASAKMS